MKTNSRVIPWPRFSFWCGLLVTTIAAGAQAPANVSPDRVTFYSEPNYKGEALMVEAGAAVENLDTMRRTTQQPWTYAISSVKIEGTARAVVYSGAGFSGERLEISASVPDLYATQRGSGGTWDRSIASVSVIGPQRAPAAAAPTLPPVRYETAPPPPQTVYVVPAPATPPPRVVQRPRLDPRAADMMIYRAYREVLDRSPDPEGLRLYRHRLLNEGWSERDVVQALQRSREARGVSADEAIRRAYQEVLGRDPDANGLAHYRSKWREGWTQGQIRDDLRRSVEGRNNSVHNAIVRAYRDLLGREPDPAGYATYERLMRERGYSERDIRRSIMDGDEYRQRKAAGGR